MLTKHIRQFGTLKGSIVDADTPIDMTIKKLKSVKIPQIMFKKSLLKNHM